MVYDTDYQSYNSHDYQRYSHLLSIFSTKAQNSFGNSHLSEYNLVMPSLKPKGDCYHTDFSFVMPPNYEMQPTTEWDNLSKCEDDKNMMDCSPDKRQRVQFKEDVTIHEIPSFRDYSDQVRSTMWRNTSEIANDARRNRREFIADGFDWRCACEEESMFLDANSGELIHPVHVAGWAELHEM